MSTNTTIKACLNKLYELNTPLFKNYWNNLEKIFFIEERINIELRSNRNSITDTQVINYLYFILYVDKIIMERLSIKSYPEFIEHFKLKNNYNNLTNDLLSSKEINLTEFYRKTYPKLLINRYRIWLNLTQRFKEIIGAAKTLR